MTGMVVDRRVGHSDELTAGASARGDDASRIDDSENAHDAPRGD